MCATHPVGDGWIHPSKSNGAVWFEDDGAGGVASPLEFAQDDTNLVASIYAVVFCTATTPLATLVSAPSEITIENEDFIDALFEDFIDTQKARSFETEFLGQTNSVFINGAESASIAPSANLQLVEFRFTESCKRSDIFIGGKPFHWNRQWRGAIAECLIFGVALDDAQSNAVKRYLSVKYKMRLPTDSDDETVRILRALGIDDGGVFSTMIMVR
ncbi:MAG: hypothetical protein FWG05_03330 [Kiritimatiellaeota bacterium]|nr:hypothetical protein [Kiritimatiellota bacterium]